MKAIFLTTVFSLSLCLVFGQNKDFGKAETHFMLQSYEKAAEHYEKAFNKSPELTEAIEKAAYCYKLTYQLDKAAAAYDNLFLKGVPSDDAIVGYGQLLKQMGKYSQARSLFQNLGDEDLRDHFVKSVDFAEAIKAQDMSYRIDPEYLNTPQADFGMTFYNDDYVYTSFRRDFKRNVIGKMTKEPEEINYLFKTKPDKTGFLTTPKFMRSALHDNDMIGEAYLSSADNKNTVVFMRGQAKNGLNLAMSEAWMGANIQLAEASENGDWESAQAFRYNLTAYSNAFPYMTKDGNAIYFASNQAGGFGGYDIYVCYKDGDSWSTPENLGDVVNTAGDEISPFLIGETLYFSSDWHWGLGGQDIFKAEKIGEDFGRIVHLGNGVNSDKDDYNFRYDERLDIGYITSNRRGADYLEDIFRIKKNHEDLILSIVENEGLNPIGEVTVDMSNCVNGNVYTTDTTGRLSISEASADCSIQILKAGYKAETIRFSKTSGLVEVQLTKVPEEAEAIQEVIAVDENNFYKGKVINKKGEGIDAVKVTVFNKITGETTDAWTDDSGFYKIKMTEGQDHELKYSKEGHIEFMKQMEGPAIKDLGVAMMVNVDNVVQDLDEVLADAAPQETIAEPGTVEDLTPRGISEGYAIQIMSLSKTRTNDLDFSNLKDVGYVYNASTKDWVRYMVGIFVTKKEAEKALAVVKKRGYERAFIKTTEVDDKNIDFVVMKGIKKAKKQEEFQTKGAGTFAIQLATYKDLKWFDSAKVEHLGDIEYEKVAQGRTVVRITGMETKQAADKILEEVYKIGFTDAYVIE